jgi:hypothetical protein
MKRSKYKETDLSGLTAEQWEIVKERIAAADSGGEKFFNAGR